MVRNSCYSHTWPLNIEHPSNVSRRRDIPKTSFGRNYFGESKMNKKKIKNLKNVGSRFHG